jgi:hypothetical protein
VHRARASLASLWVCLITCLPAAARAGQLSVNAGCAEGTHISFTWTFTEDPAHPTGHPEWVGYDVLRRDQSTCGAFVRVSAAPYPRGGGTESYTYTETPPAPDITYQYEVILVDANRQPVVLDPASCDCSAHDGWASCPEFSAPLTQGTLLDIGWALLVQPCADGCSPGVYITGPQSLPLKPYAGTGEVVRFYGQTACGSLEGCALTIDHYELAGCGPTPAARHTWGQVKAIYR